MNNENNYLPDIDAGKINFEPMSKRFMVWDIMKQEFITHDSNYCFARDDDNKLCLCEIGWWAKDLVKVDSSRYIIVQSTNLFDRDGKEIFEGSIIKVPDDWDEYGMAAGEKYEVYFNAGGFRLKPHASYAVERGDRGYWLEDATDFELLGHVLSNPELLQEEE